MKRIDLQLARFSLAFLLAVPIVGCETTQDVKDVVEEPEPESRVASRKLARSRSARWSPKALAI